MWFLLIKELSSRDSDLINEFIHQAMMIEKRIHHLCYLEINEQKDSPLYKETLTSVDPYMDEEAKQYKDPYLTEDKLGELINYLLSQEASMTDLKLFRKISLSRASKNDLFLFESSDNMIYRRVLSKLTNSLFNSFTISEDDIPEPIMGIIKSLTGEESAENIFNSINKDTAKNNKIQRAIERDFLHMFLYLMEEYKKDIKYSKYWNNLTIIKYNLALISTEIERDLLASGFTVSDDVYFGSKFIFDLMGIHPIIFEEIKNLFAYPEANYQVVGLLNTKDGDFEKPQKGAMAIARQCLLRSALSILDDDRIVTIKKNVTDYTLKSEYLVLHKGDSLGQKAVMASFDKVVNDRAKTKFISINPNT